MESARKYAAVPFLSIGMIFGWIMSVLSPGLLIAVAPRYHYCSGATFTVAVAPLLLAESSADSSAATFLADF